MCFLGEEGVGGGGGVVRETYLRSSEELPCPLDVGYQASRCGVRFVQGFHLKTVGAQRGGGCDTRIYKVRTEGRGLFSDGEIKATSFLNHYCLSSVYLITHNRVVRTCCANQSINK